MSSVLIVEDDDDSREALSLFLRQKGHQVEAVRNGKDALAAILTDMPDVVLLDLFLPEVDGPSVLEVVRSYLRLQSLPVVIMTALPDSPMVERARHLKVNAILVKGRASLEDVHRAVEEASSRLPT
ncbi:MAG TPA: response regulator [Tepidisphaeraceae bacterium]|nr:response regulator [Tepidisphaeraceae bacterium]